MTDPQIRVHGKDVNLHLLRKVHADRFYSQDWYMDEPFMHDKPRVELTVPDGFEPMYYRGKVESEEWDDQPSAIEYAVLYLAYPDLDIWKRFLWTKDTDRQGQRIYVGGVDQGRTPGFQIHRHLHITDNWGVATWREEAA